MGRKKIKIQPIQDDRNRQVKKIERDSVNKARSKNSHTHVVDGIINIGHLSQTQAWINEESIRIERVVQL